MNTSVKAYTEIVASGLLSKRQLQVYDLLVTYGILTGNDISRRIPGGHKRLSELEDMGKVEKAGTIKDSVTGKTCVCWQAADNAPKKNTCMPKGKIVEWLKQSEIFDIAYQSGYKAGFNDGRAVEIIGAEF